MVNLSINSNNNMKHFYLLTAAVLIAITAMTQSPSKFNYQAVARDASSVVISNGTVGVKVSILAGSATGTEVYSETHSAATNVYGMMNFQIGAGSSAIGDISTITWGSDAHFIKVEMDPAGGSSYTVSNTSELISVPYAEYANSALHVDDADADSTNEVQMMMMSGDTLMLSIGGGSIDLGGYDQSAHVTADMDLDSTNELITNMTLDGDTILQITEDGVTHEVDLTALVNDNDWVRSGDTLYNTADSLIGIGTKNPFIDHKMTLEPGNALGGLMIKRSESAAASKAGVTNSDWDGTGFRIGFFNQLKDGSSGAYGIKQSIEGMDGAEYGIRNDMSFGTSVAFGLFNRISRLTGTNTSGYGVYNYVKGYGSEQYGVYNTIYSYYAGTNGFAYGSYNRAHNYGGNSGRAYGTYNYAYTTGSYKYAYGAYNFGYAAGSYGHAYGSYNVASGGQYGNYAVYSSGSSYATGYWSTSDRKLKKNIRDYQGALSDIMELQPRIYDFKTEDYPNMSLPEQEQFGLIAQELEEVFPNLVQAAHNPAITMTEEDAKVQGLEYKVLTEAEIDEEGNEVAPAMVEAGEAVDFKAVNIDGLIPVLIKGIQEQQAIIEANEAMIEDLKARIEILEN